MIHDAGLRATAPRVAVLRLVTDATRPLSHAEVVDAVGTDNWDAATLYRNLIKLNEAGLLRVASQVGGITRFESQTADEAPHIHPHFACRDCGDVTCLHEAVLSIPTEPQWREALLDADLQVVGRCPTCRRRSTKPPRRSRRA